MKEFTGYKNVKVAAKNLEKLGIKCFMKLKDGTYVGRGALDKDASDHEIIGPHGSRTLAEGAYKKGLLLIDNIYYISKEGEIVTMDSVAFFRKIESYPSFENYIYGKKSE